MRTYYIQLAEPVECPVRGAGCRRTGCGPRSCEARSHLGRLSRSAVAKLLKPYANFEPTASAEALLGIIRSGLNDEVYGATLYQDLVEASLDYDPDGMG